LPSPTPKSSRAADVVLLRCHHYRSIRAFATALPPLRCAPPPRFALLPPPPRCRQAAANVALLRCRHHRLICAAAFALPPLRCALPQRFIKGRHHFWPTETSKTP